MKKHIVIIAIHMENNAIYAFTVTNRHIMQVIIVIITNLIILIIMQIFTLKNSFVVRHFFSFFLSYFRWMEILYDGCPSHLQPTPL